MRDARLEAVLRAEVVDVLALRVGVQRPPQRGRAVVQRQRAQAEFLPAIVQAGLTVPVDAVEADAPLIVVAVAAAHVQMRAQDRLAFVGRGQAGQGFVAGPLGDDVDVAADASVGADAVHQGAGALEHFDTLHEGGRHAVR
ncbi:hypothetical protein D3C87_1316800 [compost metagenome]